MKTVFKSLSVLILLLGTSTIMSSFSGPFGGEGFEIFLNNKLVVQQFGSKMDDIKNISLNNASPGDQLSIRYFHCGRIGKSRTVYIKNKQNTTVKQWRYKDASKPDTKMACSVNEILALKKNTSGMLGIYYSSTELPKGRLLARVDLGTSDITSK